MSPSTKPRSAEPSSTARETCSELPMCSSTSYARVGGVEPIEKRRQPITCDGLTGPQAQPPAQQAVELGERLFGFRDFGENRLRFWQQNPSGLRQLDAPADPVEQCGPEPCLSA